MELLCQKKNQSMAWQTAFSSSIAHAALSQFSLQQNIVDTCQKRVRLTLPCARVIQSFYENEPSFVCNMMQYVFPDRSCTRHVTASCWRPFQSTAQVEAMELMIAEFQEKLDVTIAKLVLGLAFWAELAWLTSLMSLGTSTLDRGLCRPSNIDKFLSI